MTAQQDLDRDRAASVYDADLHHLALLADEPKGANPWPGIAAICAAITLACISAICAAIALALTIISLSGCSAPSAQQEAEDVADDAATAQMQAATDARCHSRAAHEQLACAVDALAELQPDRWTPEEVARGHEAARIAGAER